MASEFLLVNNFSGFETKRDPTNIPAGILVKGSQNVIISDGERVASRKGYTLFGAPNNGGGPIVSSYVWKNHRGQEFAMRSFDTTLQFLYNGTWITLKSDFTSVMFNWAEFWDNVNKQDVLLFVNGTTNIFSWDGGVTTIASYTTTTITKSGTTTWAQDGFDSAGTLIINGVTYTYTGGYSTQTLTGVTPDPTVGAPAVGSVIYQPVKITANSSTTGLSSTIGNDLISILYNQTYIGSLINREVYVSKINTFIDYSFGSPRLPGQGALLTLDATAVAFDPQEDYMSIHAGQDQIYQTLFTLSSDNANETLTIKRLKTSSKKAAQSQSALTKIINDSVFVSNEPTLDTLGRVEQINTVQTEPLSDPIKPDYNSYNLIFTHLKYFKNNLYQAIPAEGLVLIRNLEKGWWEAPQTFPVRRLEVIGDQLIGHSSLSNESDVLFSGYDDNGAPIRSIAAFSYMNFGSRTRFKGFTEWYTEGYMSTPTNLNLVMNYEYAGFDQQLTKLIDGADSAIIFATLEDDSLGSTSLGDMSLGGGGGIIELLPPKFRAIRIEPLNDFYEIQPIYISDDVNQQWELLAFGPEVTENMVTDTTIKA